MKKLIFLLSLTFCAFNFSIYAQRNDGYTSSNLTRYADDLKRQTVDLSDRTSRSVSGGYSTSRADLEEAFLAAQIDASAGLFQQLVNSNRSSSNLRDAVSFLTDTARRAPSYGSNGNQWRNIQNSINDINRELGNGGGNYPGGGNGGGGGYPGGNGGGGNGGGQVIGRAYWRGTVDDKVQITVQDQEMRLQTLSGRETSDANFSFTSPLPNRKVYVEVNKQKGRGTVRVVQQPSRENNFSAVIEISDDGGGAKEYQLEIFWR